MKTLVWNLTPYSFLKSHSMITSVANVEHNLLYRAETRRHFSDFLDESRELLLSIQLRSEYQRDFL